MKGLFTITGAAIIWALGSVGSAQPEGSPIPGQLDPRFEEARQAWLEDDDLDALERLAQLARVDVTAAQILLSRIARAPHLIDPIADGLDRRARIELLREPVGLSGCDWMERASNTSSLAEAFWQLVDPDVRQGPDAAMIEVLASHSEIREALRFADEIVGFSDPNELIALIYRHNEAFGYAAFPTLNRALNMEIRRGADALLMPRDGMTREQVGAFINHLSAPQGHLAAQGTFFFARGPDNSLVYENMFDRYGEEMIAWIEKMPELQPLSGFCRATCPAVVDQCLVSMAYALTLAGAFPHPLASPAQSLISDQEYWTSVRFESDLRALLHSVRWSDCS